MKLMIHEAVKGVSKAYLLTLDKKSLAEEE